MISASVAPLARFIIAMTWAFLLFRSVRVLPTAFFLAQIDSALTAGRTIQA
jgi:hypothetical protein